MKGLALIPLCLLLYFSCQTVPPIGRPDLGSDIDTLSGRITRPSLKFSFPLKDNSWNIKRYFHYIYFEGNTVCFSYPLKHPDPQASYSVYFVYQGQRFPAERTGISKDRIWGFSLLGTLLEECYPDRLGEPLSQRLFPLTNQMELLLEYSTATFHTNIATPLEFIVDTL